jgi:xanthine dehydrogenase accessory factor
MNFSFCSPHLGARSEIYPDPNKISDVSRRETEQILDVIRDVRAKGQRAALATVVRVRGSAYRREGAQLIVREDGTHECLLSGGCLEPAVAATAARVISTGEPVLVPYDLQDDSVWGLGIGCSGAVDVYIELLSEEPVMRVWFDILERAEPGVLVTPLAGATGRQVVRADGSTLGQLTPAVPGIVEVALERLTTRPPHDGAETIGSAELYFAVSAPPPHLLLFGAGHDAVPLAGAAWDTGFAVTIADTREAFLTAERFPRMTMVLMEPGKFANAVTPGPRTFVVVMNHHIERDRESLRLALESDAPYIGVLGPRSRLEKLLAALEEEGFTPGAGALSRVRSPIGLAVGAETPEEIAVSILGEILALERGFDGGFLNGRVTSLHRPVPSRAMARS